MKKLKMLVLLLTAIAMAFTCSFHASAAPANASYKYPITVESDDWFDHTVLEKTEMLRIDNDKLKKMSSEELVRAVGDFPYLVDIYVYDSLDTGIEMLKKNCDAFSELMLRKDGKAAMEKYGSKIIKELECYPRKDGRSEFVAIALEDIIEALEDTNDCMTVSTTAAKSVPYTPNHHLVPYKTYSETHTANYHSVKDNEVVATYDVTLVRNGSCKYNCHSYAWHSTASTNPYWINNPSIYMTDGSYILKHRGSVSTSINLWNASYNDKIYYASNTHSAIFIDNPSNGAPLATGMARSKWGQLGVFNHTVVNVPSGYNYSTVSIWHR